MFCPRCGTIAAGRTSPCSRCGSSLARPDSGPTPEPPAVRAPTNRGEAAQRAAGIEARSLPKAPTRPRAIPPLPGSAPAGSEGSLPGPAPGEGPAPAPGAPVGAGTPAARPPDPSPHQPSGPWPAYPAYGAPGGSYAAPRAGDRYPAAGADPTTPYPAADPTRAWPPPPAEWTEVGPGRWAPPTEGPGQATRPVTGQAGFPGGQAGFPGAQSPPGGHTPPGGHAPPGAPPLVQPPPPPPGSPGSPGGPAAPADRGGPGAPAPGSPVPPAAWPPPVAAPEASLPPAPAGRWTAPRPARGWSRPSGSFWERLAAGWRKRPRG